MDYQKNTVKQLQAIAKERGLKRYSALRKADLITFLLEELPRTTPQGSSKKTRIVFVDRVFTSRNSKSVTPQGGAIPTPPQRPVPAPRKPQPQRPVPAPRPTKSDRPVPAPQKPQPQRPIPTPRPVVQRPIPALKIAKGDRNVVSAVKSEGKIYPPAASLKPYKTKK